MRLRSKRGWIVSGIALIILLFLVRPGAGPLKTRIANSIGMALQRRVDISKVHIRILPQPGFDLDGFVVHDSPAFGAEPVLRAPEVTASLRLSALFRGRLEISRLNLSEPSLNLVRRDDGRWNIENFLERTASITVAPTGRSESASRPAFPYIEADRGRINFKFGPEKKSFAITDAKYAIWQESENTWGLRLRGQPIRTNLNLSDTGELKVDGTWQRAGVLRDTPVAVKVQWNDAQLGQLSKFLSGQDRGWRATVHTSLELSGTPADLNVRAEGSLHDFRRYDIAGNSALDLKIRCDAHYSVGDRSVRQIACLTPVGDGFFAVRGEASNLLGTRAYDLQINADRVPLNSVLALARRAKKDLPGDLRASGTVDARFHLQAAGQSSSIAAYEGSGQTSDFRLQSEATKLDLAPDVVSFFLKTGASRAGKARNRQDGGSLREPDEPHLVVGPLPLKLGRPSPTLVQAWIMHDGYVISLKGDAEVRHLLQAARTAGIPVSRPNAIGSAKVDLRVAGVWMGFANAAITGTAELHSVQAQIRGLNGPLEISSAKVLLNESDTRVEGLRASVAGTHWTGSVSLPRTCPGPCPLSVDLHADELSSDQLNNWLNPNPPKRPWYRFSTGPAQSGSSFLTGIRAMGTITANRVQIRNLPATRVTARLDVDHGKLRLSDVRADILSARHRGEWRADFIAKPPVYSGTGTLDGLSLNQLAEIMHDSWISGIANTKYKIELTGYSAADLFDHAQGEMQFEMHDGSLPHVLVAAAPLRVRRFTGTLVFSKGELELQQASLESPTAIYAVSGKASTVGKLDVKLVPEGSAGIAVTGTLSEPKVTPIRRSETQAALKP